MNVFRAPHWFVLAAESANQRAEKYYGITGAGAQRHNGVVKPRQAEKKNDVHNAINKLPSKAHNPQDSDRRFTVRSQMEMNIKKKLQPPNLLKDGSEKESMAHA